MQVMANMSGGQKAVKLATKMINDMGKRKFESIYGSSIKSLFNNLGAEKP